LARPDSTRPSLAEGCCGFGGQWRDFYLTAAEAVDPGLREKYAKNLP
jgi:hypothetical protein